MWMNCSAIQIISRQKCAFDLVSFGFSWDLRKAVWKYRKRKLDPACVWHNKRSLRSQILAHYVNTDFQLELLLEAWFLLWIVRTLCILLNETEDCQEHAAPVSIFSKVACNIPKFDKISAKKYNNIAASQLSSKQCWINFERLYLSILKNKDDTISQ